MPDSSQWSPDEDGARSPSPEDLERFKQTVGSAHFLGDPLREPPPADTPMRWTPNVRARPASETPNLGPLAALQPLIEGLRDQAAPGVGTYAGAVDVTGQEAFFFGIDAAGRDFALRLTPDEFERLIGQLQQLLALVRAGAPVRTPWIDAVVDWWANELTDPTDVGAHPAEIDRPAKDRASIVWPDAGQLRIFRGYLTAFIQDRNLGMADLVLKTDYDPLGELWEACVQAKIDPRCFPQKTIMRVREHQGTVAKGYGAAFETFWRDPLWSAAQRGPEYP